MEVGHRWRTRRGGAKFAESAKDETWVAGESFYVSDEVRSIFLSNKAEQIQKKARAMG